MSPFTPGAVLGGRYLLHSLFEDDGLTQIWTATDQVLARPVLIEALPVDENTTAHAAFVAAVASAARLGHPGVVSTYDSGQVDDSPFVVTERPSGVTLADVLERQGPLPAARVVAIGRQLGRALEAAHRLGVVHGGVSATTIVLSEDDRARLGRFATCGTRARIRFGGAGSLASDVHDLARTLTAAAGSPLPASLVDALSAAQVGGTITTAGAFSDALDKVALGMPAASGHALTGDQRPRVSVAAPERRVTAGVGSPRERRSGSVQAVGDAPPISETSGRLASAVIAPRRLEEAAKTPPAGTPPTGGSRAPMVTGVAVSLVLVVAIAITAFALSGGSGGSHGNGGTGGGSTTELAVASVHSFNPLGDSATENEQLVAHLTDGDPATVWSTSDYKTERFGNLKPGTGVYLTLAAAHVLHHLTVTSASRGWAFSVYVAGAGAGRTPADLAGWGRVVAGSTAVTGDVTQVDLGSASGGALLVWITDLGLPLAHPDVPGLPYRVDIGEIAVA